MRSEIGNKTVLVAMSGGVDSSTAAAVLLENGYRVAGVTMLLWPEDVPGIQEGCCGTVHLQDARFVCHKLGIRHYTMDLRSEFRSDVVEPFIKTYLAGKTPNPCILCNQHLKFRHLLAKARAVGADFLATGHYARILGNGPWTLARGMDSAKDQSYFLFTLGQDELRHLVFPLGNLTKEEVRAKAADLNLPVHAKSESQDICFIPPGGLQLFMEKEASGLPGPGAILDAEGNVLGTHEGACFYTVGQRKGLGVSGKEPLYVVNIDARANTLTLGTRKEALSPGLIVKRPHWAGSTAPETPFRAQVQIRHRHSPSGCRIDSGPEGRILVTFDEPQHGVSPGQAAVFYDGDIVSGGGWIDAAIQSADRGTDRMGKDE